MTRIAKIFLFFVLLTQVIVAQNPACPSPYVYMDGGTFIKFYDPSLPLSATNPSNTNIPTFGGGLALMPNINGGTLTPTFYTTSGGTYWYWSGVSWVNTGHSTGNGAAVNIAGCNGAIYNIVGATGQVYVYNGTANGTLLTTLNGFNGGGPYDLVTDCNCNFYALNTTSPTQNLTMFSPTGAIQCTYSLSGMPNTSAGGGFAIIGNMIYVKNNVSSPGGFYIGEIIGSSISFTSVPNFTNSPGDFASCPVCYSTNTIGGVGMVNGGVISCSQPTVFMVATTSVNPVTYSWSGPGLVGATNGSVAVANTPGTYSCTVSAGGCPPSMVTVTTNILTNVSLVLASISPSGNICLPANTSTVLVATHPSTTDVLTWYGPSMAPVTGTETLSVSAPGVYSVQVLNPVNGCVGIAQVTVSQIPVISANLSANSICTHSTNGSNSTITVTASGANNYTFYPGPNVGTNSPNNANFTCFFNGTALSNSILATGTIVGQTGVCSNTQAISFNISPNPTLTLSGSNFSICPGLSQAITVTGANTYTWNGGNTLNTYSGNSVISTPVNSSGYSVMGSSNSCKSALLTTFVTVLPLPTVSITPATSTICLYASVPLVTNGTGTSYMWSPPAGLSATTGSSVMATPAYTQIYTVIASLNSCTSQATAVVNIVQPPVLNITVNNPSLCASNFNGSPNSVSLTPSGAASYSILAPSNLGVSISNGPVFHLTAVGAQQPFPNVVTATLIGVNGVCTVTKTQTLTIIPNPTLTITPPTASICPGKSQGFSASGATSYHWMPALNYSVTAPNAITANPLYTSFYSVYGADAGCRSDTKNAVLIVLPVPEVTITPRSNTVCAGNSVSLIAGGNSTSYLWTPSTSLSSSTGATVIATPAATQVYTVTGVLNTCTNTAIATVSVITIPVISVSASNYTVCRGATTVLSASGAGSYHWLPTTDLNQEEGNVIIARPNQNTTFTVHGYNGICTGSASIDIITVKPPDLSIISNQNTVCKGNSLPIQVKGAQSYSWSPANALIFTGSDTLVMAYPSETTNYTVVASTSMGTVSCYQTMSYSVIVVSNINAVVSENAKICLGDKITLRAGGGNTFSWTPALGLNITDGSGVVANPTVSTIYTVEVSYNSYCSKTTTVSVDVFNRPSVFAGRDTSYNLNEVMWVQAVGTGSVTWIQGESIDCINCHATRVYPSHNGCYVAEIRNEQGCTAYDDICLEVREDFSVYIPNSFTPNNDEINDYFMVYGEGISNVSMEIFDRWGVKVFSSNDAADGWNGAYKDGTCKADVYTYRVFYTGLDRKAYSRTGHVSLIK